MKKSRSLFSQLQKKAILYGLVDEGGWLSQMLASRKTLAEHTKLTKISALSVFSVAKNSVNLCESVKSVVNFSSCLSVLVAEIQSIKNNKLCETNPISERPKMNIYHYKTKNYDNKSPLSRMEKQTQTNPIYGEQC